MSELPSRPKALTVKPESIPDTLKASPNWVVWRYELREDEATGNAKWDKVPYKSNHQYDYAKSTDPTTWLTFEAAYRLYKNGDFDGLFFALPPDRSINGGDFDHCLNGCVSPREMQLVRTLNTYTEISPSGTGLRTIGLGSKPSNAHSKNSETGDELYDHRRFLSITGHHLDGCPSTVNKCTEGLAEVYAELFGEDDEVKTVPMLRPSNLNNVSELVQKAMDAKDSKFKRLFCDGDISGYSSHSEADMALCGKVRFYAGDNADLMDSTFRRSALMRRKWDELHGEQTYGEMTIQKVIAQGGEVYDLGSGESDSRYTDQRKGEHPYRVEDGCLMHIQAKKQTDGTPEYTGTKLTNFNAWIEQALTHDDGLQQQKYYKIKGELQDSQKLPEIIVAADAFPRLEWLSQWDGRAITQVGPYIKEHVRAAVQFLSNDRGYDVRYVYSHVGLRKINGKWAYLHAGGAIDGNGLNPDVDVELKDTRLAAFDLPSPAKNDEERKKHILTVISLLDDATVHKKVKEWLIYFEVAKVFRAPLNEVLPIRTSDFLAGTTGVLKTAFHAVSQSFFGAGFTSATLPGNWSSTDNQIERLLYTFKDAVCEIDDFKPHGNTTQIGNTHAKADRVFRNHANKQGRGRLRANSELMPTYYSRAFPSSSGEDIPIGQSLRGRMLIRELKTGDIDREWLAEVQDLAASGAFAQAMSDYLCWLAPRIDALKKSDELHKLFNEKRDYYTQSLRGCGAHAQTYGALADVYIGFWMCIQVAKDTGAIDEERASYLLDRCDKALITIGSYQGSFIRSEDPSAQFINLIAGLLTSGRAHLCDVNSNEVPLSPHNPRLLGWDYGREHVQKDVDDYGQQIVQTWVHKGPCIGWIDETTIYLDPTIAYAEAQKLARDRGSNIPFSETTLYKQMKEQGLVHADTDGKHIAKKKKIAGNYKRTLWIDASRITGADVDEEYVDE